MTYCGTHDSTKLQKQTSRCCHSVVVVQIFLTLFFVAGLLAFVVDTYFAEVRLLFIEQLPATL